MTNAAPNTPFKKRAVQTPAQALKQETEAAKMLRLHLKAIGEDGDADLVLDMIEGETNLFEVLNEAVKIYREDEAAAAGLKVYGNDIKDRRARIEARAKTIKTAIGIAMKEAGGKTRRLPLATVSVREGAREPVITEEADLPAKYFKEATPPPPPPLVIDMEALEADLIALKEGESISGAHLGEPKLIVTIRKK